MLFIYFIANDYELGAIWYGEYKGYKKVVNLSALSSLVAPYVVLITTYGATNGDNAAKSTIFCFQ